MERSGGLSELQVAVAEIFFGLDEAAGFLVAGGAALVASELIARPTEDIDLFAAAPTTSVSAASRALQAALGEQSHEVLVVQEAPTFCRLVVSRAGEETLVDLAVDSPPHERPTMTVLGPTMAPLELAGRKLLALFGRAEARDFADVYVLADRFGTQALIEEAQTLDAGFDLEVLAQMIGTLDRFDDDEIPLDQHRRPLARTFFAEWANELRQRQP
ncbi:nucleotidyl transferase AbiEii/AbiGii toxin family protein [Nocardioides sp. W7]|uniref:nucleotidyl transferase AbiEii/AbiGii toxin family protein n=1 Tax=Nocardioides sp. W7 TaxID=2931390 RepID=UPI001FD4258A|nr:nucleotidyl transferase AbiEii/AbiGii toxin family protein [Nocardioides sp. W7]